MAGVLPIVSGVTGLISGLSNNKKGRATSKAGAAAQQFSLDRLQQLYRVMMGLGNSDALNLDKQNAQADAADRRAEHTESRTGVSALVGAGYKPGDSVFTRVVSGIGDRHKYQRDQNRQNNARGNLMTRMQLYQMPAQVLGSIHNAGNNLYNQGQSQIQSPAGLLGSGFLEQISGLFGKKKGLGVPTSLDNTNYGNYA